MSKKTKKELETRLKLAEDRITEILKMLDMEIAEYKEYCEPFKNRIKNDPSFSMYPYKVGQTQALLTFLLDDLKRKDPS